MDYPAKCKCGRLLAKAKREGIPKSSKYQGGFTSRITSIIRCACGKRWEWRIDTDHMGSESETWFELKGELAHGT